ncbi:unnamed protein product, partial [Sphacelaria rigidula]
MLRSKDFDSLHTAHHKLLLRVVGFRSKDRNDYKKTISCRAVLEMINCELIETTVRKYQLWLAGALVRQKETRLPKRMMNGCLTTRGPMEVGRPPNRWNKNFHETCVLQRL